MSIFMFSALLLLAACTPQIDDGALPGDIPPADDIPLDQGVAPVDDDTVLVTVNGESITQGDVNRFSAGIPAEFGLSDEELLEELIMYRLIFQEADRRGIVVSDADVENMFLEQGVDPAVFAEMPAEDYEQIIAQQKEQLVLMELGSSLVDPVTEEEVREFYEANREMFGLDENVTFEEISMELTQMLEQERMNEALFALLDELEATADIS